MIYIAARLKLTTIIKRFFERPDKIANYDAMQEALKELGDLPRITDSLKKADPATYDDEYRRKNGL